MLPGPTGWADTKLLFYFGRHSFGSFQYSRLASSWASYIPYTAQGNGSCWACLLFTGIASKGFWHTPASWWTAEQRSICLGHASWVFAEYSRALALGGLVGQGDEIVCWEPPVWWQGRWEQLLQRAASVIAFVIFTENGFIAAVTDLPWAGRQSKDCGFDQYANPEDHDLIHRMNAQQKPNIPL